MRYGLLSILAAVLFSVQAMAAPTSEKTISGQVPLDILTNQPTFMLVPSSGDFKDRYIITAQSSSVTIIDTETWDEIATQPSAFSATITGLTLLPDGNTVVVSLGSGKIGRIELDNIATENAAITTTSSTTTTTSTATANTVTEDSDDPRILNVEGTTSFSFGALVADPDSGSKIVYVLDSSSTSIVAIDLTAKSFAEVLLSELVGTSTTTDSQGNPTTTSSVTLNDIDITSSGVVYVTASRGYVFVWDTAGTSPRAVLMTPTDSADDDNPNLDALAITPTDSHVYFIDTTNDVVWAMSASSNAFIDQLSGGESIDPVRLNSDENSGLSDIAITDVTNPTKVYGFVSGQSGLSVLDLSSPGSTSGTRKIVDQDTSTSTVMDPIDLSATPGLVTASTVDDGYVYTANGDASISVLTENPYVIINTDTAVSLTESAPSFTVTFKSDTAGNYRVKLNSDVAESTGTALIANTALTSGEINTNVTTSSISLNDYSRATFDEGSNRVFVFVEDSSGNLGRDAFDITVDRPPPAVTVTASTFGNERVYAIFDKLSDNDIKTYHIVAKLASIQATSGCSSDNDFTSDIAGTGTATGSNCTGNSCKGAVTGLTNGVYYCLAVRAEDNGGQFGSFGILNLAAAPEKTVGPGALLGELGGCSLNKKASDSKSVFILLGAFFLILLSSKRKSGLFLIPLLLFVMMSRAQAQEMDSANVIAEAPQNIVQVKPDWFSLEFKGVYVIPTNSTVSDSLGKYSNVGGETEFGLLLRDRYSATISAGWMQGSGDAVGITSGTPSGDRFKLMTIPMRTDLIYRFNFLPNQLLVPYLGAGADFVYFKESVTGSENTSGLKYGFHGRGGVSVLLNKVEDVGNSLTDSGISKVYLTFEGRYSMIDSFKSTGLDLSSVSGSVGFMLTF